MIKIDPSILLKQYNLNNNQMSNIIEGKTENLIVKSLTIKDLLSNLNLEDNQYNQLLAQELIKLDLPLTEEYFNEINQFLNNLDLTAFKEDLTQIIKTAIMLKRMQLPLNLEFFELFKEYIATEEDLSNNLNQLLDTIENLSESQLAELKIEITTDNLSFLTDNLELNLSDKTEIITQLETFLTEQELTLTRDKSNQLLMLLNNFAAENNNPSPILTEEILDSLFFTVLTEETTADLAVIDSQQENLVRLIAHLIESTDQQELTMKKDSLTSILPKLEGFINSNQDFFALEGEKISAEHLNELIERALVAQKDDTSVKQEAERLENDLAKEIKDIIVGPNNLNSETVQTSINSFNLNNSDTKLIEFLFNLSNNLTENQSDEQGEDLLKQLIANKIINYDNQLLNLLLPVFNQDEELENAKIRLKQEKKEQENQTALNFSFLIDSHKLGQIEVKVKFKEKRLSTLFITDNQKTDQLIKANLEEFKDRLAPEIRLELVASKFIAAKTEEENDKNITLTSVDFKI